MLRVCVQTENFSSKSRTLPMDREREDDLKRLLHSDVNADKTASLLLPGAKARKRYSLGNSLYDSSFSSSSCLLVSSCWGQIRSA